MHCAESTWIEDNLAADSSISKEENKAKTFTHRQPMALKRN